MEQPLYSVLVYSKYSDSCKNVFAMIEQSGVDFTPLKLLCIDNDKVRERISKNQKLQIKYVPCILSIFNNGLIEKYEGPNCVDWLRSIITLLKPKNEVISTKKVEFAKPIEEIIEEEEEENEEETKYDPNYEQQEYEKSRQQDTDRHRNVTQPKRVRKDETSYEENEEFYAGEQVDNRKESGKSIKKNTVTNVKDRDSIIAKAREMEMGREASEQAIKKKPLMRED